MTAQLLAQALAIAYNPQSSSDQLMDVIGDLIAFGAYDAAEKVFGRLRAEGKSLTLVEKLEKAVASLREFGPIFEDSRLAAAIAASRNPDATDEQLLRAAECLVVYGSLDEGDRALARLREKTAFPAPVARLAAASRQLRRSGILSELQSLTPSKSLNKPYEVLVRRRAGAKRVIVVFTGVALRFWLSLNALHLFLRKLNAHVIYLSDHSGTMYLNGLTSIGPGYQSMLKMLKEQLGLLDPHEIYVLATSVGGFVGLRAAMDLQAECFAGMSIRTTLAPSSSTPISTVEQYAIQACKYPEMLVDLRPLVEACEYPRRIQLYCGDHSNLDLAHAHNLAEIPRVEINYLEWYKRHDAISGLIARGEFERMLQRFIEAPGSADQPTVASA